MITRIKPGAVRIKVAGQAEEAKRAAEEALANRTGAIDYAKAQAELAAAIARVAALRKFRQRKYGLRIGACPLERVRRGE